MKRNSKGMSEHKEKIQSVKNVVTQSSKRSVRLIFPAVEIQVVVCIESFGTI